ASARAADRPTQHGVGRGRARRPRRRGRARGAGTPQPGQALPFAPARTRLPDRPLLRRPPAADHPPTHRSRGRSAAGVRLHGRAPADPADVGVPAVRVRSRPPTRSLRMNDSLATTLKQLRLSGLLATLDVRLQEAAGHQLGHAEFLELVLQDELAVRSDRQLARRTKAASFREPKTLDEFDWAFNPSLKRKQIYDLATGRFIREARDVLLLGPPGVRKT